MPSQLKTINIIQDVPTPHNNCLIRVLQHSPDVHVNLWYAVKSDNAFYQWNQDLSSSVSIPRIYGRKLSLPFLYYCLTHPSEYFFVIGWMNINTKLLHILFFVLNRSFNHWTDCPQPIPLNLFPGSLRSLVRYFSYSLLRCSKAHVFCVGSTTINFFRQYGFASSRLTNLPIFIDFDVDPSERKSRSTSLRSRYNIDSSDYVICTGSRLIYDKGFDLLLKSISHFSSSLLQRTKVFIVGSGEQLSSLQELVTEYALSSTVIFINWLALDDFKDLIASSDVFVQPSRFDAYGSSALAMSLGTCCVASTASGAGVDRIVPAFNGFLYSPLDTQALSSVLQLLMHYPDLRENLAYKGFLTAQEWPPARGRDIIINHIVK